MTSVANFLALRAGTARDMRSRALRCCLWGVMLLGSNVLDVPVHAPRAWAGVVRELRGV